MKNILNLVCIAALTTASIATAQETRSDEVRTSKNPADDQRPNSDKVPEVIAIPTQFERVVMLRFKYDTDFLPALEKAVKDQKIRNGIILSGIGALRNYILHQVSNRTLPNKVTVENNPTVPSDIISMNGTIIDGHIHPHVTLATPDRVYGGHLHEGNLVFVYAIVTIGVLPDSIDMSRFEDTNYR